MFAASYKPRFGYLPDINIDADVHSYINLSWTTTENDFEYNLYCSTFAAEVAKTKNCNMNTVRGRDRFRSILSDENTWEEYKNNKPFKNPELLDIHSYDNLKKFSDENELIMHIFRINADGKLTCIHQHGCPFWKNRAQLLLYSNRRNLPESAQFTFRYVDFHFLAIVDYMKFKQSPLFKRSFTMESQEVVTCGFM